MRGENENTLNLKSASFIIGMLLHEGLTVAFWREFHFKQRCSLFVSSVVTYPGKYLCYYYFNFRSTHNEVQCEPVRQNSVFNTLKDVMK